MKNIPFHEEVREFAQKLISYLDGTCELACEHVHSCCILIADKRLKVNGKWHTWINYSKFLELYTEWQRTGTSFTALDYSDETPAWAVYGAKEGGFNPNETRWKRKSKGTVSVDSQSEVDDIDVNDSKSNEATESSCS